MSVNAATMEDHVHNYRFNSSVKRRTGFMTRVFGCWHSNMSIPTTFGGETYRVCLDCGARRSFDAEIWTTYGPYYFGR